MIISCLFSSCSFWYLDGDKYDKLILTDEKTGKKYLLKHHNGDSYFIDELVIQISGKDTILMYK
jgi:hypothetical protein